MSPVFSGGIGTCTTFDYRSIINLDRSGQQYFVLVWRLTQYVISGLKCSHDYKVPECSESCWSSRIMVYFLTYLFYVVAGWNPLRHLDILPTIIYIITLSLPQLCADRADAAVQLRFASSDSTSPG